MPAITPNRPSEEGCEMSDTIIFLPAVSEHVYGKKISKLRSFKQGVVYMTLFSLDDVN
jgi:hypothetical protein